MVQSEVARRDVLKFSVLGAAALALPLERVVRAKTVSQLPAAKMPVPYTLPFAVPPVIDARDGQTVNLKQSVGQVEIVPGLKTTIFGYHEASTPGPVTPGPTIHCRRGKPINVYHLNELDKVPAGVSKPPWNTYDPWTSTHLHGSASKPQYDGYASDVTNVGQTKHYFYPNKQDARTLWYHDHGVHHTAENAYMGLAAQYHLHDDVEDRLPIPKWDFARPVTGADGVIQQFDLPLILADKMFAADGQFRYDDAGHTGLWGDVVLVNGVPWPTMKVYRRKYRFRILNASISRGYRLQLGDGKVPFSVIGTDGGLMPALKPSAQIRIGMAERYEVIIDFTRFAQGQKVELRNLGVPNSTDFDNTGKVVQFEVLGAPPAGLEDTDSLAGLEKPYGLNPNRDVMDLTEDRSNGTTTIDVVRSPDGIWKIQAIDTNKVKTLMSWEDIVASQYKAVVSNPKLGDVQIWTITNKSGGWFHPVHIHLVDFKVLSRNGKPAFDFEQGPKDVVYVGENESIRAIMRFGGSDDNDVTGRYMIHCHNLPHEDHDMMTQFRVGEDKDGPDGNDPIGSDPAR
jgi:spore coat protein A, manganese oxidase